MVSTICRPLLVSEKIAGWLNFQGIISDLTADIYSKDSKAKFKTLNTGCGPIVALSFIICGDFRVDFPAPTNDTFLDICSEIFMQGK